MNAQIEEALNRLREVAPNEEVAVKVSLPPKGDREFMTKIGDGNDSPTYAFDTDLQKALSDCITAARDRLDPAIRKAKQIAALRKQIAELEGK